MMLATIRPGPVLHLFTLICLMTAGPEAFHPPRPKTSPALRHWKATPRESPILWPRGRKCGIARVRGDATLRMASLN